MFKTKTKILSAIVFTLVTSAIIILVTNWEMINATYKLCKVEIQLSYYIPKLESHTNKALLLSDKVDALHSRRGELDSIRKGISEVYIPADLAIDQYIYFEPIN